MPFFQMRLKAEAEIRKIRREDKPYIPNLEIMSKPANETPVKKSKPTKVVEAFEALNLEDKGETLELMTELYRVDLQKKQDDLMNEVSDLKNKQEKLK